MIYRTKISPADRNNTIPTAFKFKHGDGTFFPALTRDTFSLEGFEPELYSN